jgi:hypothetical protein
VEIPASNRIDVSMVKMQFAKKFPDHPLTHILLSEPDSLTGEELLAKAQTWLAFFKGEDESE